MCRPGPIPKELAHLRKLRHLTLEENQLFGIIPDELVGQLMRHGRMCLPVVRQRPRAIQAPTSSFRGGERPRRGPAVHKGSGITDDSIPHIVAEEKAHDVQDGVPPQVTLASSLGPEPAVYVSTSHGVEFETQAGSISARSTVHGPVTVSPCLQIVECPAEGSSRALSDEEDVKEEFLITAVIGGPEEVSFRKEKPAKLRFFVGYVDEIASEHDLIDNEDIKKYVLETYRPLTSPDGKGNWTNMQPFSVLFPPSVDGKRGVWVETTLHHFSFKAIAMNIRRVVTKTAKKIPRNTVKIVKAAVGLNTKSLHIYERWVPPRLKFGNGDSRKRMVRFGNYTQYYAVFVYYPTVTFTKVKEKKGIEAHVEMPGGAAVGGGIHKETAVEGHEHAGAREPILVIVEPGAYSDHELHAGLKDHEQVDLIVGVLLQDNPDEAGKLQLLVTRKISRNTQFILRKQRMSGPFAYQAIDWKCTTRDILEAVHPVAQPVGEVHEEVQPPVVAPPVDTGPMPALEQRNMFRRVLPGLVGVGVAAAVSTLAAPVVAVVAGVGAIAAVMSDDEDDH
ncbi:unnamed protein product [Ectocarpus sp. 13 AM-2016]